MKLNTTKSLVLSAALAVLTLPLGAAGQSSGQNSDNGQNDQYNNNRYNNGQSQNGHYNSQNNSENRDNQSSSGSMGQNVSADCGVSKILNAKARSTDNQDLGKVQDVIINPQSGKIDFVVLGKGGVLGIGQALGINAAGQEIPVPWQATTLQSDGTVTINRNKSNLQSAPSISRDYSNLNQPGYVAMVFDFYGVSNGGNNNYNANNRNGENNENSGAAESPGGVGQGNNHGANGWNNNMNNNR